MYPRWCPTGRRAGGRCGAGGRRGRGRAPQADQEDPVGRLGEGGQLLGGGWGVPDKKNAVGGVGPAGVPDGDRPVFRPEAGGAAGAGGRPFPLGPLPWAASVAWFRAHREGAQVRVRIRAEEGCRAAGRNSDGAAVRVALIQATRGSGGCCGAPW